MSRQNAASSAAVLSAFGTGQDEFGQALVDLQAAEPGHPAGGVRAVARGTGRVRRDGDDGFVHVQELLAPHPLAESAEDPRRDRGGGPGPVSDGGPAEARAAPTARVRVRARRRGGGARVGRREAEGGGGQTRGRVGVRWGPACSRLRRRFAACGFRGRSHNGGTPGAATAPGAAATAPRGGRARFSARSRVRVREGRRGAVPRPGPGCPEAALSPRPRRSRSPRWRSRAARTGGGSPRSRSGPAPPDARHGT